MSVGKKRPFITEHSTNFAKKRHSAEMSSSLIESDTFFVEMTLFGEMTLFFPIWRFLGEVTLFWQNDAFLAKEAFPEAKNGSCGGRIGEVTFKQSNTLA